MKTFLATLVFFVVSGGALLAGDQGSPREVAQDFYNAYLKVLLAHGDPEKFVLSSDALTDAFKQAYRKMVKEGMESDPIICGQDYPDEGFNASPAKIQDGKARVTMKSRSQAMKVSFPITLRKVDGAWRISDTNDLKADAAD